MKLQSPVYALATLLSFYIICFGQPKDTSQNLNGQIKQVVKAHFSDVLDLSASEIVVEYAEPILFATTSPEWDNVQVLPGRQRGRKGSQVIKIGLFRNGQLLHRASGRVRVRTFENLPVASERLERHALIGPNHVSVERRETTRSKSLEVLSMDEIVGQRTTRIIQRGEIIRTNMIEATPVVMRGEPIHIRFIKGAIEIVLPGIARQDGYAGDKIRVKCLETKKLFNGDVLDSRTVIVNL